mgnify:CR=1 FL=1
MANSTPAQEKVKKENREFSRIIDCNKVSLSTPFHWLSLGVQDMLRAPLISLVYGALFSAITYAVYTWVFTSGSHLVILPSTITIAFIGPIFASGLYDTAWELEKGHKPTLFHSLKSMFRNPVSEWGFAILLMVCMIAWTRIAALIHALYPTTANPTLEELMSFLTLGSIAGALLAASVFAISVFTPQILLERRVDIMTAVISSINAVQHNIKTMILWASILFVGVAIGFFTAGLGFLIIMPILSYASWHAYIAVIKTKKERGYE